MSIASVMTPLRFDRKGEQLLTYAVDFANRLKRPLGFLMQPPLEGEKALAELRENRGIGLLARFGAGITRISSDHGDDSHIIIADKSQRDNRMTVCIPFDEKSVAPNRRGKVMVPFGTGESSLFAFSKGAKIIKDLNLPVLFYHTTWPNPRTQSEDPIDHVCDEAREVLDALRNECHAQAIPSSVVIQMTDSVVHGALLCALKQCCRLMVVARGKNTGKGSYVDQWLDHSTVPMLIIGRES